MSCRKTLRLATVSALAVTLASLPAYSNAAGDRSAAATEFSVAQQEKKGQDKQRKRTQEPQHREIRQQPRQERKVQERKEIRREIRPERKVQEHKEIRPERKVQEHKEIRPERKVQERREPQQEKRRVFKSSGPNATVVTAAKIRDIPAHGPGRFAIRGHNYSIWREGYRVRYHDHWRTFVPLTALAVLAVGAATYYPYAYIEAPQPFCEGLTEDGCYLDWAQVETIEGDLIDQCVAYCPWQ